MKRLLAILLALLGWAAIITQFYLMMENRVASKLETSIRFFSFFTILTNIMVASYFSLQATKSAKVRGSVPITVYITIVGLVYQLLLRHTWSPTGLQLVVDELLHSVVPFLALLYWFLYEPKSTPHYQQIGRWMLYPLAYLVYILIRGSFSGFYPYPFVHVTNLGMQKVLINSAFLLIVFVAIAALFIRIKKADASTKLSA